MEKVELPLGWIWRQLGDKDVLHDVQPGFACGKKDVVHGTPHLRMNNISKDGYLDMSLIRTIPKQKAEQEKKWLVTGDVIFNNTNSTELVGKSCLFTEWNEPCTFSNHITRLRSNKNSLLPEWLYLCLRELWLAGYFAANCVEFIGQSAFNRDKLLQIEIPVPTSIDEQHRIVARIEELTRRVEEASRLRREAVRAANSLFQRAIEKEFSESKAKAWHECSAESLFTLVSGQVTAHDNKSNDLPYLGPEHIESGTGRIVGDRKSVADLKMKSSKYLFSPEHVVYSKIRPALRKVCAPNFAGLCSADMYALRSNLDLVSREFLFFTLLAPQFSNYAVEKSERNAMPKINREALFAFRFKVPERTEQQRVVSLLSRLRTQLDELLILQRESEAELAAFTPALLAKAFRGEL